MLRLFLLPAALFLAVPAAALEVCAVDQRVTLPDGGAGTVLAVVSPMCMVQQDSDRNVVMITPDQLTAFAGEEAPLDIRSITPGVYACNVMGIAGKVLEIEMMEGNRYAVAGDPGDWASNDPQSLNFVGGPLDGIYGSGQNRMIMFSDREGRSLVCVK